MTGAYRAVVYIKEHMKLDATTASEKDSKEVVRICTVYAQKGMWNIFIVIFCFALALPFFNPYFFIGYLIAIAFFGLFQAIFMANAGGAWDNAKKIVEVDLRQKGTDLHAATVVGDTVGDPFKDTSSVALNPVIKFTTLFGLLAVEIAVTMTRTRHQDGHRRRSSSSSRCSSCIARSTGCAFPRKIPPGPTATWSCRTTPLHSAAGKKYRPTAVDFATPAGWRHPAGVLFRRAISVLRPAWVVAQMLLDFPHKPLPEIFARFAPTRCDRSKPVLASPGILRAISRSAESCRII